MDGWRPIEIFALYLLAAAGCTAAHPDAGDGGSAGNTAVQGGTPGRAAVGGGGGSRQSPPVAGAAGGGSAPQRGSECGAPMPSDSNPRVCAGGVMEWDGCKQRSEDVQCYVAKLKNGQPDCLPDSDPMVIPHLAHHVFSNAFEAEFVIDSAPGLVLPASCEDVADCCDQLTDYSHQLACFDTLKVIKQYPSLDCSSFATQNTYIQNHETWGQLCPTLNSHARPANDDDAGRVDVGDQDGGTGESSQHGLCCYEACGHLVDT